MILSNDDCSSLSSDRPRIFLRGAQNPKLGVVTYYFGIFFRRKLPPFHVLHCTLPYTDHSVLALSLFPLNRGLSPEHFHSLSTWISGIKMALTPSHEHVQTYSLSKKLIHYEKRLQKINV